MRVTRTVIFVAVCAIGWAHAAVLANPVGNAITYQGQLKQGGVPFNGTVDLEFKLWDAAVEGEPVGETVAIRELEVVNGLFTVPLDFGPGAFTGNARWLEVGVRSDSSSDDYTVLSPRQALRGTPYAHYALSSPDSAWAPAEGGISYFGGDLGIGTDVPLLDLQVHEDLRGGRASGSSSLGASVLNTIGLSRFFYMQSDDTAAWLIWDMASDLRLVQMDGMFNPAPWERMRITAGPFSKVGIGTTDPQAKLHVDSTRTDAPVLQLEGGSDASPTGAGVLVVGSTAGRNIVMDGNEIMARDNGVASKLYLNADGGDVAISASGTGNVGIGTSTPAAMLDVAGTARIQVLEILGADLAEKFPISDNVKPGMVVAIDPKHPGNLCLARGAYNQRVAGVVSGANDLPAGTILGNLPGYEDATPIALTGRVYVWADASNGSIEPGDLLTTSNTPGHAMKATDRSRSYGATIGKAMTGLEEGRGLVLVLVNLQ